jgi:hypothetical protein
MVGCGWGVVLWAPRRAPEIPTTRPILVVENGKKSIVLP